MSYNPNHEWIVIDKTDDLLYFKDLKEVSKYFNLTLSQIYAISNFSLRRINMPSPTHHIYIQRLYIDVSRTPRNFKNFEFHNSMNYIYPNINKEL